MRLHQSSKLLTLGAKCLLTGVALVVGITAVCGKNSQPAEADVRLVSYQQDHLPVILVDGEKGTWEQAKEKSVVVDGLFWIGGKEISPRLLLDNCSLHLDVDETKYRDLDRSLVRVSGKLVTKVVGDADNRKQSFGRVRAYFVVVTEMTKVDKVQSVTVRLKK